MIRTSVSLVKMLTKKHTHLLRARNGTWIGYDRRPIYLNYPERGEVFFSRSKQDARIWWRKQE